MTQDVGERRRDWLERARLYLVTESAPGGRDPEELLRPALQGGVDVVQLRDKSADDRAVVRAGRVFRRLCDAYDALFIVNDRPDLAIACGADGVHLGQHDGHVAAARQLLGEDPVIGLSTHSPEQVDAAREVDYVAVGPVYATPTKPEYPAFGPCLVADACSHPPASPEDPAVGPGLGAYAGPHSRAPFFAIGGIDPGNVAGVVAAGAERVAVVRAIRDAADPATAARVLRELVEAGAAARAR